MRGRAQTLGSEWSWRVLRSLHWESTRGVGNSILHYPWPCFVGLLNLCPPLCSSTHIPVPVAVICFLKDWSHVHRPPSSPGHLTQAVLHPAAGPVLQNYFSRSGSCFSFRWRRALWPEDRRRKMETIYPSPLLSHYRVAPRWCPCDHSSRSAPWSWGTPASLCLLVTGPSSGSCSCTLAPSLAIFLECLMVSGAARHAFLLHHYPNGFNLLGILEGKGNFCRSHFFRWGGNVGMNMLCLLPSPLVWMVCHSLAEQTPCPLPWVCV